MLNCVDVLARLNQLLLQVVIFSLEPLETLQMVVMKLGPVLQPTLLLGVRQEVDGAFKAVSLPAMDDIADVVYRQAPVRISGLLSAPVWTNMTSVRPVLMGSRWCADTDSAR